MAERPTGTVTFVFTDIEGSTRLLHELGSAYDAVLADHRSLVRAAFDRHAGYEVDTILPLIFVKRLSPRGLFHPSGASPPT